MSLLSDKQQQILEIIGTYLRDYRRPPTNREIGGAMGMSSTGHVDYHLGVLEKRGVILRESNTARGVRLTQVGEDLLGVANDQAAPTSIGTQVPRTIRVPIHGRLQPANQSMQPIYVAADDLTVQGKVVALIRRV